MTYCKACQAVRGEDVPCITCPYQQPEIMPANADVWELWTTVQTQWRFAPASVAGLDYTAVDTVARWLDLDLRLPILRQGIRLLESLALDHYSQDSD